MAHGINKRYVVRIAVGLMLVASLDVGEILIHPGSEAIGIFEPVGVDVGAIGADENSRVAVGSLVKIAITGYPGHLNIERTQDFRRAEENFLNVLVGAGEGGDVVRGVMPAIKV